MTGSPPPAEAAPFLRCHGKRRRRRPCFTAARRYGPGRATVRRRGAPFRGRGPVRPGRQGGSASSRIEPERRRILRSLAAQPELSTAGLRDAPAAEGVAFDASTVQRFLERRGLDRETRLAARRRKRGTDWK